MRTRLLLIVSTLIFISLIGSVVSVFEISHVNRSLTEINEVSIPLNRLFTQILTDSELYRKESQKGLSSHYWNDPNWKPQFSVEWMSEVIISEFARAEKLVQRGDSIKLTRLDWLQAQRDQFLEIDREAKAIYELLVNKKITTAVDRYPAWLNRLEAWHQRLAFGVKDFDRSLTVQFEKSQSRVNRLRTGLELILLVVFGLSLLILWLSERALRPLHELTRWVRAVTDRGLKREDKEALQEFPLMRAGEVNELAREFHHLATQLLEREKVVEAQRLSLEEQNRQARELGKLNETVLASIRSPLLVTDLKGRITRANPSAIRLFSDAKESVLGRAIESVLPNINLGGKIEPHESSGRVLGGHSYPLKNGDTLEGHVIILEDLTDELSREKRLREAEHLAAIGRLSAQVAHEVRNPLHSIGLEAELALDLIEKGESRSVKSSIQAVLSGVDRLERITENYLKLSRRAPEERKLLDLRDIVETSLANEEMSLKSAGVTVNWKTENSARLPIKGDASLLEQIFGNLIRNSIQACEGLPHPRIEIRMGMAESGKIFLRFEDSGPGIAAQVAKNLFTPFVTTKASGTGLGLSFVKRIVDDHGGEISASQPQILRGASFLLTFPQAVVGEGLKETRIKGIHEESETASR